MARDSIEVWDQLISSLIVEDGKTIGADPNSSMVLWYKGRIAAWTLARETLIGYESIRFIDPLAEFGIPLEEDADQSEGGGGGGD